jgi:phosphoribosylanthranilate isomerase
MVDQLLKRTRVKICGITRPEDGLAAARLGADAIGLVFYPPSPRAVTVGQARAIIEAVPPLVTRVALFVDAGKQEIENVLGQLSIDLLQFHGNETADYCRSFGRSYIKAVRMVQDVDLQAVSNAYSDAAGLLLDSFQKGVPGGTGESFDWARIPVGLSKPIILAGGLGPENVAQAIAMTGSYAVDVSSGVESAKGIKDASKIASFMHEVRDADRRENNE